MLNINNLKADFIEVAKFTKEFIIFQKILLKPLLAGFTLSFLLTSTRLFHTSFCTSLNSIFSLDLLIFASYTAAFFHILSPWCRISRYFSESIYEVASQITFFLISGITAALMVMNYQESAIPWLDLLKFTVTIIPFFYIVLSCITIFPYFLLMNKPATGKDFKEISCHSSMLFVYGLFILITIIYFIEPTGFPGHDFCEKISSDAQ